MKVLTIKVRRQSIFSAMYEEGKLFAFRETPWNNTLGFGQLLRTMENLLRNYRGYDCIGLCAEEISCAVEPDLILSPRNISGKKNFPLRTMVEDFTKVPVLMEHRVNAFSVGEAIYGAAKGMDSVLCIHYGSHVTSGIVGQGTLYAGASHLAGNIGHMSLYADGLICECGRRGCYERYASTEQLVQRANMADTTIQNGIDLMQEVNKGNPVILHIVRQWTADVVRGLVSVVYLLDPEGLVLGGGIFREGYMFEMVKQELLSALPRHRVQVLQAKLGQRAALEGIANLAMNNLKQRKVTQ